jgi:dTDP-4-dehydrorhamnose 3,5-epimerase
MCWTTSLLWSDQSSTSRWIVSPGFARVSSVTIGPVGSLLGKVRPMTDVRESTARSAATSSDPTVSWSLVGPRDRQIVGPDWAPTNAVPIEGVVAKQMSNVLTGDGYLTEIWRPEWQLDGLAVGQVFQRVMDPGGASGWHAHGVTTDRLFCGSGRVHLGLYDGRRASSTHGNVADFWFGNEKPAVIVVPPASSRQACGTRFATSERVRWSTSTWSTSRTTTSIRTTTGSRSTLR